MSWEAKNILRVLKISMLPCDIVEVYFAERNMLFEVPMKYCDGHCPMMSSRYAGFTPGRHAACMHAACRSHFPSAARIFPDVACMSLVLCPCAVCIQRYAGYSRLQNAACVLHAACCRTHASLVRNRRYRWLSYWVIDKPP